MEFLNQSLHFTCQLEFCLNLSVSISVFLKIIPRSRQICAFKIPDLFKAPPDSTLKPRLESKEEYYNWNENNFCVLPDEETLIGANRLILKCEDMTRKELKRIIDKKRSPINTMIFNQNLNSLLVGEENGCFSQYGRNHSGDFKKQKEYGDVGVGVVYVSDWSGNFAVVGGRNGKISLINMKKRQVIAREIRTAIGSVCSLTLCRVSQSKMHLAVGGYGRDYSNSQTDLFNVSDLLNLGENQGGNVKSTNNK